MSVLGEPLLAGDCARNAQPRYLEPLVVDWRSTERADLEVAMRQGVVPVRHECGVVRLVKSCRISGSYDFAGVSRKSEVIQLASEDELRANLPLSSVQLAAQVQSGATVDLALLLIGKRTTSVADVVRSELEGSCDEVTHFVRAAHVGAFAFTTGEVGHVTAAAEIFKIASAGADSQSKRKAMHRDGSLEACEKSTPEAERAPAECGAALRVELVPILDHRVQQQHVEASPKSGPEEHAAHTAEVPKDGADAPKAHATTDVKIASQAIHNPCVGGYVWSGGKCVRAGNGPHLCEPADHDDCEAQCGKGSEKSCYNLARILQTGTWEAKPDPVRSKALYQRACAAEVAAACVESVDYSSTREQALPLLEKGCSAGSARGCIDLARYLVQAYGYASFAAPPATPPAEPSPETLERSFRLAERACTLDGARCADAAEFALTGVPKHRDVTRAAKLFEKACFGQDLGYACRQLGELSAQRKNLLDPQKTILTLATACELGETSSCAALGHAYRVGEDVPRNTRKALLYLERGCRRQGGGDRSGCLELADMYERGEGGPTDQDAALEIYLRLCRSSWMSQSAIACDRYLGLTEAVPRSHRDEDDIFAHASACGNQQQPSVRSCKWIETHVAPRCAQGHRPACDALERSTNAQADIVVAALNKACSVGVSCGKYAVMIARSGKSEDADRARVKACEAGDYDHCFIPQHDKAAHWPSRAALERACKTGPRACMVLRAALVKSKLSPSELLKFDEANCLNTTGTNRFYAFGRSSCRRFFDALIVPSGSSADFAKAAEIARMAIQYGRDNTFVAALDKVSPQLARPLWGELCRLAINASYWNDSADRLACEGYERTGGNAASLRGKKDPMIVTHVPESSVKGVAHSLTQ